MLCSMDVKEHNDQAVHYKSQRIHRLCAEAVPETTVDEEDRIQGIEEIPKARWKLASIYLIMVVP